MTFAELKIDIVILACGASAGIHAALAPEHFREGAGPGAGFVFAAVLLALLAIALTHDPSPRTLLVVAAVLGGLIASYALVVATGVPVLHPEREQLDGLALATKAIEAFGLVLAASLVRRPAPLTVLEPEGALT